MVPYTQKDSTSEVKEKLLTIQAELENRLSKLTADATQYHSADSGEQAVERENDEVVDQLINDSNNELQHVNAALVRIESGQYGVCGKCGKAIGEQRLKALSYATLCIECVGD